MNFVMKPMIRGGLTISSAAGSNLAEFPTAAKKSQLMARHFYFAFWGRCRFNLLR